MVKSSKGFRTGTRRRMKKGFKQKFKSNTFLQEFKPGNKVVIKIDSSSPKSSPHPRMKGRIGEVKGKRGQAYVVRFKVGNVTKEVITKPEHLKLHSG